MNIISHRGYWLGPFDKNLPPAFRRSFDAGFGTETDLRDAMGRLVISHDMPRGGEASLPDLLDLMGSRDLPLAINIKSDGMGPMLRAHMQGRPLSRWFTFDMSVPEMVVQMRLGLPVYSRASEYERRPALYDQAIGVWLDGFVSDWASAADIAAFLQDGKRVAIVSPELHRRAHLPLWALLRAASIRDHPELTLCTDMPEAAAAFFG